MPFPRRRRLPKSLARAAAAIAVAAAALGVAGCGAGVPQTGPSDSEGTIGLLLPEAKTARYETFDRPFFEARVEELGDYRVLYSNADQDAAKQQQQAESALAAGVDVLVLDPVDATAAVSIVQVANAQDIPVVSYDRLIAGGDLAYYVSFDNEKVGELQASAFVSALDAAGESDGSILVINGSPTDSNAELFRTGARSILDDSDLDVLAEYDTPGWSPEKAQQWVAGQLAQHGHDIAGIYAANDGTAGGAVAALKAANVPDWPIITGQDAELTAIQRLLTGDQYMTVYKAIRPQAELAAEVAVALLHGEEVTAPMEIDGVPTTLLDPVAVTVDDIAATVIADGFWTADDICTPAYADACAAAGIE
ncbi:D-xylose transport system substrate-binding protein [Microbacterium terrae]|uniref:D-xylose-binding periplasmic protein n=1 Tax=Microbacterium terrae TaxID=69369 RepID=A0A0M2H494_9MICO|nr:substrate-binding domain-containing protein [Microbacterium terrae]KJL39246.1 D-xylose-binding periplasmic protein precursor [Microbacterium terrae]MBP1076820.1 D-xylose transport system substrate-binding protein [Microbacterium terrae]GLJ99414.1 ABC transporter substrate-binding protein [Microbacterium terrae]